MFSRDYQPVMKACQTTKDALIIFNSTRLNDVNKLILGWSGYHLGCFLELVILASIQTIAQSPNPTLKVRHISFTLNNEEKKLKVWARTCNGGRVKNWWCQLPVVSKSKCWKLQTGKRRLWRARKYQPNCLFRFFNSQKAYDSDCAIFIIAGMCRWFGVSFLWSTSSIFSL